MNESQAEEILKELGKITGSEEANRQTWDPEPVGPPSIAKSLDRIANVLEWLKENTWQGAVEDPRDL